nr:MADS-box protein CMB1-like isoform X1 [Tanacetum cinerariifolium]
MSLMEKIVGVVYIVAAYQRQVCGEDLEQLSIKELEQLERQLDSTLKQIRSMRTQSMLNQLSELQLK